MSALSRNEEIGFSHIPWKMRFNANKGFSDGESPKTYLGCIYESVKHFPFE
jgi:hypothetical protein